MKEALERVVADLSDGSIWNWACATDRRRAADAMLGVLAREGLIDQRPHPDGGTVWRVNGKLFGRTDRMTLEKFDSLRDA